MLFTTVTWAEDIWTRDKLTGDWWGARTSLSDHGFIGLDAGGMTTPKLFQTRAEQSDANTCIHLIGENLAGNPLTDKLDHIV